MVEKAKWPPCAGGRRLKNLQASAVGGVSGCSIFYMEMMKALRACAPRPGLTHTAYVLMYIGITGNGNYYIVPASMFVPLFFSI